MHVQFTSIDRPRSMIRVLPWVAVATALGCAFIPPAAVLGDAAVAAGSVIVIGLGYAARFIVHASLALVLLSLAFFAFCKLREYQDAIELVPARCVPPAGAAFVSRQPIFELCEADAAAWGAGPADWSLIVHLSSWLWLLIGLGLLGLLSVAGIAV